MADTATLDAPPTPAPEVVASPERVRIPGATMARAVALLADKGIKVDMGALTAAADGLDYFTFRAGDESFIREAAAAISALSQSPRRT